MFLFNLKLSLSDLPLLPLRVLQPEAFRRPFGGHKGQGGLLRAEILLPGTILLPKPTQFPKKIKKKLLLSQYANYCLLLLNDASHSVTEVINVLRSSFAESPHQPNGRGAVTPRQAISLTEFVDREGRAILLVGDYKVREEREWNDLVHRCSGIRASFWLLKFLSIPFVCCHARLVELQQEPSPVFPDATKKSLYFFCETLHFCVFPSRTALPSATA